MPRQSGDSTATKSERRCWSNEPGRKQKHAARNQQRISRGVANDLQSSDRAPGRVLLYAFPEGRRTALPPRPSLVTVIAWQ